MADLLNVDDALERILAGITPLAAEPVALDDAAGRVLAAEIRSPVNLPPFPNSAMDGYAVRAADSPAATRATPVQLAVVMDIPAGSTPLDTLEQGQAARIMTGAPIPTGADAVIPVEDTDSVWDTREGSDPPAQVGLFRAVQMGEHVRQVGEYVREGELILPAGHLLRPVDIGMLASLGQAQVQVVRQPRVAVLSSGDELVNAGMPLPPGKIYDANSHTIAALVANCGGAATRLPIARDTLADVRHLFEQALALQPDLIISSAGVSVGAADLIRTVMQELGEINFWRINLRPGKPLAFGRVRGVPFFGLPGNPVSATVTFEVLVRPLLLKLAGKVTEPRLRTAVAGQDLHSDGRRSYVRVTLQRKDERLVAYEAGSQSSAALIAMVRADGLLIIPEAVHFVPAGTELSVYLLD